MVDMNEPAKPARCPDCGIFGSVPLSDSVGRFPHDCTGETLWSVAQRVFLGALPDGRGNYIVAAAAIDALGERLAKGAGVPTEDIR